MTYQNFFVALIALIIWEPSLSGADTQTVRFNQDVLPILAENCFACHGFDEAAREADLRLDIADGLISDSGDHGVIVPGEPTKSTLMLRVLSTDLDERMPPRESGKALSDEQRRTLQHWIAQGAEFEKHWSFTPPKSQPLPNVDGVEHPIDRFVQAQLAKRELKPSELAAPETLIRRVSLDLIGLPPTPTEIDSFLKENEKDPGAAWQSLISRLLGSPHYGERWGRWWLDQARYADSNGYSIDGPRSIWKYRDWVTGAFNEDMPFDQFTIEQLAGDLLPDATIDQQIATGFHRNTQINQEGGIDREQYRVDSIFDRVATTGTVWLGLSIGCAQCHDHKFDPIAQKEFYQLFAFLNNQDEPSIKVYDPDVDVDDLNRRKKDAEKQLNAIFNSNVESTEKWESELDEEAKKKLTGNAKKALSVEKKKRNFDHRRALFALTPHGKDNEFVRLNQIFNDCTAELNAAPTTMVLRERPSPRQTTVFVKGDFTRPADPVSPGTPAVLHPLECENETPNRLDLAKWIVNKKNPLTARVIVNRVWQQYFGAGLVATENDFGTLGSRPTHPKLLDWLAVDFVNQGWSLKKLHRLIVSSHTYRQASTIREDLKAIDVDNRLLGRQSRLRLDAEIVRDVLLSASDMLSPKFGGPPVYPPIPASVMSLGQVRRAWNVSKGEDRYRRGLYTFVYRATPPPSLSVFDAPDGYSTCTRRNRSNTPLQSLTLMNDAAFFELAESLAKQIDADGIENAFRRCTGRFPDDDELSILGKLDSLTGARTMLNLDETITRE